MPPFIPGRELSKRFYHEAVRPILDVHFPSLPHAAAHMGAGSDVLGFDTEMSRDHDWGPSMQLFLPEATLPLAADIHQTLSHHLPHLFYGYPVNFGETPEEAGTTHMAETAVFPINHRVRITTVQEFVQEQFVYDINTLLETADWLTFPSQILRSFTAATIHHDGVGQLTTWQQKLAWYPQDVWLYLLAAGWARIGEEEHLMPRAGFVGDELGSALMGSRLVRDVMNLCFLMSRQYAPYPKWFGTAFQKLPCAADLSAILWQAQQAPIWQEREAALCQAYEYLARWHNRLQLTTPQPTKVGNFFNRPFLVINTDAFVKALCTQITDPLLLPLLSKPFIGSIDQWSDSTAMRSHMVWRPVTRKLYER